MIIDSYFWWALAKIIGGAVIGCVPAILLLVDKRFFPIALIFILLGVCIYSASHVAEQDRKAAVEAANG